MQNRFVGKYTKKYHELLLASLTSKSNLFVLSEPGWGKTEMALVAGQSSFGDAGMLYLRLDPSVPPDVLSGSYNPAALLEGRLERVTDGTPYDPKIGYVLADEISRASDPLYDAFIHVCDMKTASFIDKPIFVATSNFVLKGERTEALRDRFPLWFHLAGDLDVDDQVQARAGFNGHNAFDTNFLSRKDLTEIWKAKPGKNAAKTISSLLVNLSNEAKKRKFTVNPRRISQWLDLLFFNTVRETGNADFTTIPSTVANLLAYAYPTPDKDAARKWQEITATIADVVGAALDAYRGEMLEKFNKVQEINDVSQRTAAVMELGSVIQRAAKEIKEIGGGDARADAFTREMSEWFAKAVRGEKIA